MKKNIYFLIILCLFFSCNKRIKNDQLKQKSWVYIETGSVKDLDADGIYGEISQLDLNTIKNNSNSEKLILIENVRFIDTDSIIKDISIESNEKGTIFHKVKNISYLEVLKNDPLNTKTVFYSQE